jgi:cytochrome c oxidase subunit 2
MWKFQHMSGQREINELHVPVGQPVRLVMATEDVVHSFFVPAFRVKADVIPGRYQQAWFEPTRTGRFRLYCAEYCGTRHSGMVGWVVVLEASDFERWLTTGNPEPSSEDPGLVLFERLGCAPCHGAAAGEGDGAVARAAAGRRGPPLEGLFGREVRLADGSTAVADEGYLRESILRPNARIVAGFEPIMPAYAGQIGEADLFQLVTYIKSLAARTEEARRP